jgi:hypothetical protein
VGKNDGRADYRVERRTTRYTPMRTAGAGAPLGAIPNDLVAISIGPAHVPAAPNDRAWVLRAGRQMPLDRSGQCAAHRELSAIAMTVAWLPHLTL